MEYRENGTFVRSASEITEEQQKSGQTLVRCDNIIDGDPIHKTIPTAEIRMTYRNGLGDYTRLYVDQEECTLLGVDDFHRITFSRALSAAINTIKKIEHPNPDCVKLLSFLEKMKGKEIAKQKV